MPVPSASEPHLSLHRALMTDDERIIKMEDYAQQHRVFQTFEALVALLIWQRPQAPWTTLAEAYNKAIVAPSSAHEQLVDVLARVSGLTAPDRENLERELFLHEAEALEYLQGSGIRQVLQTILEKILSVHKCPPDFQDVLLGELRAVARAREGYQPPVE